MEINITVNSKKYNLDVSPKETLLYILRNRLNLIGTKEGCGKGECGACTISFNGRAVNSCLVIASQADGAEIITIEGLSNNEKLDELQEAFINHGAVQCGFCIPGMIMTSYVLLKNNPKPSEDEIVSAISGNLCRCTGYSKVVDAIKSVAEGNK